MCILSHEVPRSEIISWHLPGAMMSVMHGSDSFRNHWDRQAIDRAAFKHQHTSDDRSVVAEAIDLVRHRHSRAED